MAFEQGNSYGNRNGRPIGSKNKVNAKVRAFFESFTDEYKEQIKEDFEQLTPKERIDTYLKMLEYILPKLQRTNLVSDEPRKIQVNIESWADRFRRPSTEKESEE